MVVTGGQTCEFIRLALGSGSLVPPVTIATHAGQYLTTMHQWRWAERLARLNLRASITFTAGTWTDATKTLTKTAAFTNYTFLDGDELEITSGTGATTGFYRIQSKTSSDAIVLATSIGSAANGQTDIAGTMANAAIVLPSDFAQLIAIGAGSAFDGSVEQVSMQRILDLRSGRSSLSSWPYEVSIIRATSSLAAGAAPTKRLEHHPAAGSNSTAAFTIAYRIGWTQVADDNNYLPVEDYIEPLYWQLAEAFAKGYEEQDAGTLDARLAVIHAGPVFASCVQRDGGIQTNLGQMRGGAVQRRSGWIGPGLFTTQAPS